MTILGVLGAGLVDPTGPILRGDDLGVLRGDGVFETLLVHDRHTVDLDRHLDRLATSAAALDLPAPDRPAWLALVAEVIAAAVPGAEAMLRLTYTRGIDPDGPPFGYALLLPIPDSTLVARRRGIGVVTLERGYASDAHLHAPWLLAGAKTISYAVNMAAQRHAHRLGADDAIFTGTDGLVLEAPTAAVVWAVGATLHTVSPAEAPILASITVGRLMDNAGRYGFGAEFARATVADLHAADGVWLVSSVRGAVAVHTLDGRPRSDGGLTARVRAATGIGANVVAAGPSGD